MDLDQDLMPDPRRVKTVTRDAPGDPDDQILATRDHAVIREWAKVFSAEPATGEETASGPASSLKINDGSSLRFNFPALGRFRASLRLSLASERRCSELKSPGQAAQQLLLLHWDARL